MSEIIYLSFVQKRANHIVLVGLIVGYLIVTLSGHLQVLASVLNSGGEPQQVTSAKTSAPIDSRPVWSQKKHLLLSPKKVENLSESALESREFASDETAVLIPIPPCTPFSTKSVHLPFKPRDPPAA